MKAGLSARLPELDLFRGLIVCGMGVTHGLFWAFYHNMWLDAIAQIGIYLCYPGFLLAFGMGLGLSIERIGVITPRHQTKWLSQALTLVLAYYIVAVARLLPEFFSGGPWACVERLLTLLSLQNAPKAGVFFLSFALYLLLIILLSPHLRGWLNKEMVVFSTSVALGSLGFWLGEMAIPSGLAPYWKLLFGAAAPPRTFPVLPYLPLLVCGMQLGRGYFVAENRVWWRAQAFWRTVGMSGLAGFLSMGQLPSSYGSWRHLDPTPGPVYLLCSGALVFLIFLGCACWLDSEAECRSPQWAAKPALFLRYVGTRSTAIIVFQYFWISVWFLTLSYAGRHWGLGPNDTGRTLLFMTTMIVVPPALLFITSQTLSRLGNRNAIGIYSKSHR